MSLPPICKICDVIFVALSNLMIIPNDELLKSRDAIKNKNETRD